MTRTFKEETRICRTCGNTFMVEQRSNRQYCSTHKNGKGNRSNNAKPIAVPVEVDDRPESEKDRTISNLRAVLSSTEKKLKEVQQETTVTETVREAVLEVASVFPPPPTIYIPTIDLARKHSQEAVLQACCLHYGEVVSPAETGGFGNYNISMAQARLQEIVDSIIDLVHDHHRGEHIRKLWIPNLGDNVSGDIHRELSVTNERPVITQALGAGFLWALVLRDLSVAFDEVEMIGLPGNHGRNQVKPVHKNKAEDSFDRMVYETAAMLTAGIPNVKVTIPPSYFWRQVINETPFLFMHGDNLKAWNNIPFYGTYRLNANMTTMYSTREEYFRYLCIGHFHQVATLPRMGGEILMTGSIKGPDEYAIDVLQTGAEPEQLFYGVHHRRGLSFRYNVSAADADPSTHDRYQFDLADISLVDMARKLQLL